MVNKCILIGNLGRDVELKNLDGGTAVARLSIATQDAYKDKQGDWQNQTEWHNIVMWRELAERANKQLKKGSQVYIEGKLTHRKYKDKDGNEKYATEIVASMFRSLDKKEKSSDSSYPSAPPEGSDSGSSYDDLPF